eukprot:11646799-Ditylum_brightwellii.AAC.1
MTAQVKTLIKKFEEEHDIVLQKVTSPAAEANLLYLMKHARLDIETTVSYLMRCVSKGNTGDWDKLLRVLAWLKCTKDDVRILGAQSLT